MMARYKIQIETGLIGVALCLTIFFWSNGRAVNMKQSTESGLPFFMHVSSTEEILFEMNKEVKNAAQLLVTEPDHLVFIANDGLKRSYRYINRSLWINEIPLIHEVSTFHFEYRNRNGQLLSRANRYRDQIQRIQYIINMPAQDFTKTCIKLSGVDYPGNNVQFAMTDIP